MHSLALQTAWVGSSNPATCSACSTRGWAERGCRHGDCCYMHVWGMTDTSGVKPSPGELRSLSSSREVLVLWVGAVSWPCSLLYHSISSALVAKQGVYCWCWAGSTEPSAAWRSAWGPCHTRTHGKRGPRVSSPKKRRKQQAESSAVCTAYFMGLQTNPSAIKPPFSVIVRSIKTKWRLPLQTSFVFIYIIKAILIYIHLGFNSSGLDGLWTDAYAFCGYML